MRLTQPVLGREEAEAVAAVLDSGFLTQGPVTAQFERRIAEFVGVEYAFATSSCTTALHLILAAAAIGPGDEVILPDFTFPATINAVLQAGAKPIVADVDTGDFCIDVSAASQLVTKQTAAIMPVHAFGIPARIDDLCELAKQHNAKVIEDAACALGSQVDGRRMGAIGLAGAFSFHPRKVITTGEGGMVTTNDSALAERLQLLRSHGAMRGPAGLTFMSPGFNYRLSDVNSAIGLVQMQRLEDVLRAREERASTLASLAAGLPGVVLPPFTPGRTFQSFVILLDEMYNRDCVIDALGLEGIEATIGTYSLQAQPAYGEMEGVHRSACPNSARLFRQSMTLPLFPQQSDADLERIVQTLAKALRRSYK